MILIPLVGAGELDMDKNESLFNFSILIQRFSLWLFSHECWSCFDYQAQFFITEDQVTAWFLSKPTKVNVCSMCRDHQAPLSMGFSRQEHWSGLPFLPPMHESEKSKWSRSVLSDLATPWTAAYQAPPSMGFSRQEYWSGVPLPSPY